MLSSPSSTATRILRSSSSSAMSAVDWFVKLWDHKKVQERISITKKSDSYHMWICDICVYLYNFFFFFLIFPRVLILRWLISSIQWIVCWIYWRFLGLGFLVFCISTQWAFATQLCWTIVTILGCRWFGVIELASFSHCSSVLIFICLYKQAHRILSRNIIIMLFLVYMLCYVKHVLVHVEWSILLWHVYCLAKGLFDQYTLSIFASWLQNFKSFVLLISFIKAF